MNMHRLVYKASNIRVLLNEPDHDKTYNSSEESDQPALQSRLEYSLCALWLAEDQNVLGEQRRLIRLGACLGWYLRLRWAHRSFCLFCRAPAQFETNFILKGHLLKQCEHINCSYYDSLCMLVHQSFVTSNSNDNRHDLSIFRLILFCFWISIYVMQ